MPLGAAAAVFALAVTEVVLAWRFGFAPLSSAAFLALAALAALPAWRLSRVLFAWTGLADAIARAAILAFAAIVATGLTLGAAGTLTLPAYVTAFAILAAIVFATTRPPTVVAIAPPAIPVLVAALAIPLLALVVAAGLAQSPLTLYDAVSYHLVFPARWLLDQRLSIVPTPFSDPAQAYQPGHGELFFLWLMLPFHGDAAARIGQLPFLLLGAVSLYAIARRCGARREHAVYAPLFFLLARPVVEQAAGADVDLICAATFLASIHLGLAALESDARRDWALWGGSVGLFLGTKYLALVYVGVLLVLPLLRGMRWRALAALPGIAAFGAPWYLRNWVVAGSPIYPASLTVFGVTLAPGAFARAAMNNSVFHVTSARLLPPILAHAFGAAAFLVWLPLAVLGAGVFVARPRRWPGVYMLMAPVVMVALFWFGVPDNGDSRFLLPAVAAGMVPLTFAFGPSSRKNAWLHTLYLLGAAWLIVGAPRQIPMSLPWFMGGWLALDGIVSPAALPLFALSVALTAAAAAARAQRPALVMPLLTVVFGAQCVLLGAVAQRRLADDGTSLLTLSPTYIRAEVGDGWTWVHGHLAQATIANSGNNLPYPLFGDHLLNRVYYVNIDRHADWRFHDYARARRRAGTGAQELAQPSGQLMPLVPGTEASRPRVDRWQGNPDAWLENLRGARITHLVVTVLSAYELGYVRHNEGGFPVEDDWARSRPQVFSLVYGNPQFRVYALAQP